MKLTELFSRIEADEEFESGCPATEAQIQAAEEQLSIRFPVPYRTLLVRYGHISFSGGNVYGVSDNPYFDVIGRTLKIKQAKLPADYRIPQDGCIIENYAGGGFYFLFGANTAMEGEIIECLDETWWVPERRWNKLEDFLEYRLSLV